MGKFIKGGTVEMYNSPTVKAFAAAVGKKEGEGPLSKHFDYIGEDITFGTGTHGKDSWEKAETMLQQKALSLALRKGSLGEDDISMIFAGDLLNQCIASGYAARDYDIPFIGLYGACSTMAESLALAAIFIENGLGENAAALTSSHYCTAERQFRFPVNYGSHRTPTSQWTATASGCAVVSPRMPDSPPPYIYAVTFGKVKDYGIKDTNNMGAAMAGAAYDTISTHLTNTGKTIDDFDHIITGDLGVVGSEVLYDLFDKDKINFKKKHKDCGLMLYDSETQDVHAGGSGCGCGASVLCGYFLREMAAGKLKNILFTATGALMSPTIIQQGESIPGIAHAVHIGSL
ncbi:MAG: stage V sporulation protein AD [Oscillospiraceae bacterium]|nr:stage V sporulation protein AD [Oscillospiraceae bacterium]